MVERQRFESEDVGGRDWQKPQVTLGLLIQDDFPQRKCQGQFAQTAFDLNFPQANEAEIENN